MLKTFIFLRKVATATKRFYLEVYYQFLGTFFTRRLVYKYFRQRFDKMLPENPTRISSGRMPVRLPFEATTGCRSLERQKKRTVVINTINAELRDWAEKKVELLQKDGYQVNCL